MGGSLILTAIAVSVILWGRWENPYVWILLGVLLATGALGFYDDWRKVVYKDPNGVSAKFKIVWQTAVAFAAGGLLLWSLDAHLYSNLLIPFLKNYYLPIGGIGFVVLTYLVIVGTSNAVNLTDGLDGLAAFPVVLVAGGLAVFAYISGHYGFAGYLNMPFVKGAGEVAVFCAAMCGACLGFLWFNAYPAQVFMGDVGALALGAALGTAAVIVRQEIVLFIMGGLFVVEAVSVMLQVGWYKRTKKTHFPDGTYPPPLRTKRLERNPSGRALLDYHHRAGADRIEQPENPLKQVSDASKDTGRLKNTERPLLCT